MYKYDTVNNMVVQSKGHYRSEALQIMLYTDQNLNHDLVNLITFRCKEYFTKYNLFGSKASTAGVGMPLYGFIAMKRLVEST